MEYLIGVVFTIFIIALARFTKFEKDLSFYPTILIVIALLYVLFAVIDGRIEVVLVESLFAILFITIAIIGFKKSYVIVGIGIMLHGFFDISHHLLFENKGVPIFWAEFCLTIDFLLGAYIILAKNKLEK